MGKAENQVEGYLKKQCEKLGFLCYKTVSPGNNGFPDRVVIGNGKTAFVETKSNAGKPSEIQKKRIKDMTKNGAEVHIISTREEVDRFLKKFARKPLTQRHKYLNDLHIKSEESCIFNTAESEDSRYNKFMKQRKKYGFDERETWSLDYTHATWLYSHLMMYKEVCICDLDFHKFTIPYLEPIPKKNLVYTGKSQIPEKYFETKYTEATQNLAINLMLKYLKEYIADDNCDDQKRYELLTCALKIYAEIHPAMWW